jgi:retron-type reverse transcriptase
MVFCDISKVFDKVWHKGLLYKLKTIGVRDPLLGWFESYLTNRKQQVVIDGKSSEWQCIKAGVPQGSVLGPLLFLIYINDITENLETDCFLYADDTSLYDIVDTPVMSLVKLNNDLNKMGTSMARHNYPDLFFMVIQL